MTIVHSWHTWPSRGWFSSAAEERAFVEQLAAEVGLSAGPVTHGRGDTTAVVTALRCGATARQVLDFAPGLRAAQLLSAYHDLEARRERAQDAWEQLIDDPTVATLARVASQAVLLLPTVVMHLASVAARTSGAGLPVAVAKMDARVTTTTAAIERADHGLLRASDPYGDARRLFDPNRSGLVDEPHFLPRRVTLLSCVRIADLLGDRDLVAMLEGTDPDGSVADTLLRSPDRLPGTPADRRSGDGELGPAGGAAPAAV